MVTRVADQCAVAAQALGLSVRVGRAGRACHATRGGVFVGGALRPALVIPGRAGEVALRTVTAGLRRSRRNRQGRHRRPHASRPSQTDRGCRRHAVRSDSRARRGRPCRCRRPGTVACPSGRRRRPIFRRRWRCRQQARRTACRTPRTSADRCPTRNRPGRCACPPGIPVAVPLQWRRSRHQPRRRPVHRRRQRHRRPPGCRYKWGSRRTTKVQVWSALRTAALRHCALRWKSRPHACPGASSARGGVADPVGAAHAACDRVATEAALWIRDKRCSMSPTPRRRRGDLHQHRLSRALASRCTRRASRLDRRPPSHDAARARRAAAATPECEPSSDDRRRTSSLCFMIRYHVEQGAGEQDAAVVPLCVTTTRRPRQQQTGTHQGPQTTTDGGRRLRRPTPAADGSSALAASVVGASVAGSASRELELGPVWAPARTGGRSPSPSAACSRTKESFASSSMCSRTRPPADRQSSHRFLYPSARTRRGRHQEPTRSSPGQGARWLSIQHDLGPPAGYPDLDLTEVDKDCRTALRRAPRDSSGSNHRPHARGPTKDATEHRATDRAPARPVRFAPGAWRVLDSCDALEHPSASASRPSAEGRSLLEQRLEIIGVRGGCYRDRRKHGQSQNQPTQRNTPPFTMSTADTEAQTYHRLDREGTPSVPDDRKRSRKTFVAGIDRNPGNCPRRTE